MKKSIKLVMMEDKKSEVLNNFLSQSSLEIFFLTPLR